MKNSEKYIISEGVFNWLLKTLLGKDTATKLKYYTAIKTDRKLMALSKQLERTVQDMRKQMLKTHGTLDPEKPKRLKGS